MVALVAACGGGDGGQGEPDAGREDGATDAGEAPDARDEPDGGVLPADGGPACDRSYTACGWDETYVQLSG